MEERKMSRRQAIAWGLAATGVAVASFTGVNALIDGMRRGGGTRTTQQPVPPIAPPSSPQVPPEERNLVKETGEYDKFGGWKELRFSKTGFFYTQKHQDRWWLASPEGNAFWSKGINHVRFDEHIDQSGNSEWHQNNLRQYGSAASWAQHVIPQMNKWGFNTVGSWSSTEAEMAGMPYTPMLYFPEDGANNQVFFNYGIPDVFNSEWQASLPALAQKWCEWRKDDPYLLGYFLGNEFHWDSTGWRKINGATFEILDAYLALDPGAAGRIRAQEFLNSKNKTQDSITPEEKWEFAGSVAEEYFKRTVDAVRRYDKNHMILGTRFAGYAREPVVRAAGKYCEVISLNSYDPDPNVQNIQDMERVSGRPVMLTEFGFRLKLDGMNTIGSGPIVDTEADKARELEQHFDILSREPACVGGHVFEYSHQPRAGRKGDGENSAYGFVNVAGKQYETIVNRMSEIMPTLEKRRIGQI